MALVRKTAWSINTASSSGSVSWDIPSGENRLLAVTHWAGAPTSFGGLTGTRVGGTTQWWYWTEAQLATLGSSESYSYTSGPFGYAFFTGVDQDNIVAAYNIDTAANNYNFTGLPTTRLIVVTGFAARSGAYPTGYGVYNLTTQASYQTIISTYRHYRIADEGTTTGADVEIPEQLVDGAVNMYWGTATTRYDHAWAIGGVAAPPADVVDVDTKTHTITTQAPNINARESIGIDASDIEIATQSVTINAREIIGIDALSKVITTRDALIKQNQTILVDTYNQIITTNGVETTLYQRVFVDTLNLQATPLFVNIKADEVIPITKIGMMITTNELGVAVLRPYQVGVWLKPQPLVGTNTINNPNATWIKD